MHINPAFLPCAHFDAHSIIDAINSQAASILQLCPQPGISNGFKKAASFSGPVTCITISVCSSQIAACVILSCIPLLAVPDNDKWIWYVVAAFVLFRAFDIAKPLGIRKMESLRGGVGVMMDDILAGVYSFILLAGVRCVIG